MRNRNETSTKSMRKRANRYKIRVSVGIIGCTAILLAACSSTANTSAKTASAKVSLGDVTVQQARKIVAQYSAENNASNKAVSTTLQAQDETGYALEADDSIYRYEIQDGRGPAWQKTHYTPFYAHTIAIQSIQSHGWPKRFIAIATENTSPASSAPAKGSCHWLFVFVQNHPQGQWRVQSELAVASSAIPKLQFPPVGTLLPGNDRSLAVAPNYLSEQLASQLAVWGTGGPSPSLLPASTESSSCASLALIKNASSNYGLKGGGGTFTATAVPASGPQAIQSYEIRGGGAIVSTVLNMKLISVSEPRYPYMTYNHAIGNILPNMNYSSVTFPFLSNVLVYDPPRGHGQPEIIGAYISELWPATGTKYN